MQLLRSRAARIGVYLAVAVVSALYSRAPSPSSSVAWARANQAHLYESVVGEEGMRRMDAQVTRLRVEHAARLFDETVHGRATGSPAEQLLLEPVELAALASLSQEQRERWNAAGLQLIANGSASVLTMAGGQGTRLGFDGSVQSTRAQTSFLLL